MRNLWQEAQRLSKIANHHGQELEDLKRRVAAVERKLKGARISSGKHKAKSAKLEAELIASETKLADIKSILKLPDSEHPSLN